MLSTVVNHAHKFCVSNSMRDANCVTDSGVCVQASVVVVLLSPAGVLDSKLLQEVEHH